MKVRFLFVVLTSLTICCYCQMPTMVILDTLVVQNQSEIDVVPLHVEVRRPTLDSDTLSFFGFWKVVDSQNYLIDALEFEGKIKPYNHGLGFVVEDSLGKMQRIDDFKLISYTFWFIEKRKAATVRILDENKLKFYNKRLSLDEIEDYYGDKGVLSVTGNTTFVTVYPVLMKKLKPGRYKLFLYYSKLSPREGCSDNQFLGTMISNKVDLIVEDRPIKWWEFWRRKSK